MRGKPLWEMSIFQGEYQKSKRSRQKNYFRYLTTFVTLKTLKEPIGSSLVEKAQKKIVFLRISDFDPSRSERFD